MNLLIVDDEILAIQGLVDDMEWKKLDFDEVFTANSYAQAVNIMNKQEIDVLLCDIHCCCQAYCTFCQAYPLPHPDA